EAPDWREMVRQLTVGNEAVCRTARQVLKTAEDGSDDPTVDLMTQRLQTHEKYAWMLRSLLEGRGYHRCGRGRWSMVPAWRRREGASVRDGRSWTCHGWCW